MRWFWRPIAFMEDCRRRYGDSFSVTFVGFRTPMVMISDPEAIRALYSERAHGLPPGRSIAIEPIMGPRSILLLEGAEHLARRKLMLPPFHGERMRSYEPLVEELVEAEIERWPLGTEFPIHPRMQAITLEVILRVVFGVSDPGRLQKLRSLLGKVLADVAAPSAQLSTLITRRVPDHGPWARFQALLREIDEPLYAEIAERRADPDLEEREDILSALVAARFEDGSGMEDSELRDQLMTLLLAGHETTATALAWSFDMLLRHPAQLAQAARGAGRRRRGVPAGDDQPRRSACGRWCRWPAAASAPS